MDDLSIKMNDELEKIKAACAAAGYEFVGKEGDRIIVKRRELPELPDIKETFEKVMEEFQEPDGLLSRKISGRKRFGKRPKFHD